MAMAIVQQGNLSCLSLFVRGKDENALVGCEGLDRERLVDDDFVGGNLLDDVGVAISEDIGREVGDEIRVVNKGEVLEDRGGLRGDGYPVKQKLLLGTATHERVQDHWHDVDNNNNNSNNKKSNNNSNNKLETHQKINSFVHKVHRRDGFFNLESETNYGRLRKVLFGYEQEKTPTNF